MHIGHLPSLLLAVFVFLPFFCLLSFFILFFLSFFFETPKHEKSKIIVSCLNSSISAASFSPFVFEFKWW